MHSQRPLLYAAIPYFTINLVALSYTVVISLFTDPNLSLHFNSYLVTVPSVLVIMILWFFFAMSILQNQIMARFFLVALPVLVMPVIVFQFFSSYLAWSISIIALVVLCFPWRKVLTKFSPKVIGQLCGVYLALFCWGVMYILGAAG